MKKIMLIGLICLILLAGCIENPSSKYIGSSGVKVHNQLKGLDWNEAGHNINSDIYMAGNTLNGLPEPTDDNQAVNRGYADRLISDTNELFVYKSGDEMTGDLNMNANIIMERLTPTTQYSDSKKTIFESNVRSGLSYDKIDWLNYADVGIGGSFLNWTITTNGGAEVQTTRFDNTGNWDICMPDTSCAISFYTKNLSNKITYDYVLNQSVYKFISNAHELLYISDWTAFAPYVQVGTNDGQLYADWIIAASGDDGINIGNYASNFPITLKQTFGASWTSGNALEMINNDGTGGGEFPTDNGNEFQIFSIDFEGDVNVKKDINIHQHAYIDGNIFLMSPDGNQWSCGVDNSGAFNCS